MMLPNGWKKVKLGDLVSVASGRNKVRNDMGKYPVYGSTGIIGLCDDFQYSGDSILIARVGANAGFIHRANGQYDVSDNTLVVECGKEYDFAFAYQQLRGINLNQYVFGSGQPLVTGGLLKKIELSLPPLEEQKKIAATLSVWDSAIEKMEKLIEAKSEQKKTLTYKLIENQNDVKFKLGNIAIDKSKWKKKKFKDVFEFLPTNTYSRELMSNDEGSIKNIHYGDVLVKYAELLDVNSARIPCLKSSVDSSKMTFLQSGDIVIADTAEDETVGKAVEILNIKNHLVVSGLHTMLCRPQKEIFYYGWLGYYINSKEFHRQLIPLITGIKVSSIAKKDIVDTFILIPSIQEQKIIVETLSETNKEISLLKQQLENYKKQKQGLMQKLLTGQWRVK